jgi:putative acetyltransferase
MVGGEWEVTEDNMTDFRQALFPQDADGLIAIWREYIAFPSVDLSFQDNESEFATLPGKYAPPEGCVLLAWAGNRIVGCIAMRRIDAQICEMKRLYVRPEGKGEGLGRKLAERLIIEARAAGYSEMRLDVLPEFEAARHIYATLGFVSAEPVSQNPIPGTAFLGLPL